MPSLSAWPACSAERQSTGALCRAVAGAGRPLAVALFGVASSRSVAFTNSNSSRASHARFLRASVVGEDGAPLRYAVLAERRQPADVRSCIRGEHEAHRGDVTQREFAPAEDDMDQRAPDPAVAVGEGMDGLELCVRDGSL